MPEIRKLISYSFLLLPATLAISAAALHAQSNPLPRLQTSPLVVAQAPATSPVTFSYPDNERGLKQLIIDILKAQEKGNSVRARQLLDSLVLPNFHDWSAENFSEPAVAKVVPAYEAALPHLTAQLAQIFLGARQEGFRGVEGTRYPDEKSACSSAPEPGGRVRMGATVQAARLVCRVTPYYPEEARRAYLSGTVRLHAIIGTDGSVKQLEAVSGPDVLIPASKAAVSQWRYRPVLRNGEPVEVDTTIDVIYSLNY